NCMAYNLLISNVRTPSEQRQPLMIQPKTKNVSRLISMLACGLVLGFASMTAGASVIYNWYTIDNTPELYSLSGQLEITDAAWLSGSLDYEYHGGQWDPDGGLAPYAGDPDSPILRTAFSVTNAEGMSASDLIIYPRTGVNATIGYPWHIDANFEFGHHSGLLTGNLYVNNGESDYEMESSRADGAVWTITRFGSDFAGTGCFSPPQCSGATGFWSID